MHPITLDRAWLLHGRRASRQLETRALAAAGPHGLMQRAGLSAARLALALAPHARTVWIVCGPGNNGGDGLETALQLRQRGRDPLVRWLGDAGRLAPDAAAALQRARDAGVQFSDMTPALTAQDLAVDALLGLGGTREATGELAACIGALNDLCAPVLAVDLPTGLDPDTGMPHGPVVRARHTLSLLTLKPGLFTGLGRDLAGQVWFDPLQTEDAAPADAMLAGPPPRRHRAHGSHKGSYGDVAVLGGAAGMRGAAVLAASAALHAGAGRVYVAAPDATPPMPAADLPELMWRTTAELPLERLSVACGCGGGTSVAACLPQVLAKAAHLVLDADGLNAVAADLRLRTLLARRQRPTVLTPHPLEAARLLDCSTAAVQADRLAAAQTLADRLGAVVVLKGSGTVIAAPGRAPTINPTGNARLATAGTGDVLAGLVAAELAAGTPAWEAACHAVFRHGALADAWPADRALTASALARSYA